MERPDIPVLGFRSPIAPAPDGASRGALAPQRLVVGFDGLTLDGTPILDAIPWATTGPFTVTFGENDIATLTFSIAVSLPPDLEAETT